MNDDMLRRGVAEFIGTFTLIFIGGGAGIAVNHYGPTHPTAANLVAVALANGLAIGIMVTNLGHISGGHFNPAITLGFLTSRRITTPLAGLYWGAQLLGAAAAAFILRGLTSALAVRNHATPIPATTDGKAVVFELILTFFLVWAVWATAVDPGGAFKMIAGLAIGLTITMDVLFGGPFTGAAMNPARAFGPELAGKVWTGWWVYWIGPILGAVLASWLYEYLYLRPTAPPAAAAPPAESGEPQSG